MSPIDFQNKGQWEKIMQVAGQNNHLFLSWNKTIQISYFSSYNCLFGQWGIHSMSIPSPLPLRVHPAGIWWYLHLLARIRGKLREQTLGIAITKYFPAVCSLLSSWQVSPTMLTVRFDPRIKRKTNLIQNCMEEITLSAIKRHRQDNEAIRPGHHGFKKAGSAWLAWCPH